MATILIRTSGSDGFTPPAGITQLGGSRNEAPEHWNCGDAALELGTARNRLLLRERLVRPRLVVEAQPRKKSTKISRNRTS
jgi:hypothetical protein